MKLYALLAIFAVTLPAQESPKPPDKPKQRAAVAHPALRPPQPHNEVKRQAVRPSFRPVLRSNYYWANFGAGLLGGVVGNLLATEALRERVEQSKEDAMFSTARPQEEAQVAQGYRDPEPPPPLGPPVVRFTSDPIGAEVRMDGAYMGTTPTPELQVEPGTHILTMSKLGYEAWKGAIVACAPGNVLQVRGELQLDSDPSKPKIAGN